MSNYQFSVHLNSDRGYREKVAGRWLSDLHCVSEWFTQSGSSRFDFSSDGNVNGVHFCVINNNFAGWSNDVRYWNFISCSTHTSSSEVLLFYEIEIWAEKFDRKIQIYLKRIFNIRWLRFYSGNFILLAYMYNRYKQFWNLQTIFWAHACNIFKRIKFVKIIFSKKQHHQPLNKVLSQ